MLVVMQFHGVNFGPSLFREQPEIGYGMFMAMAVVYALMCLIILPLSPWAGQPGLRFGVHLFREKLDSTLVYATWFAGGLRVLDLADPHLLVEVAHCIPDPGPDGPVPQSNDVDLGPDGRIYLLDRNAGIPASVLNPTAKSISAGRAACRGFVPISTGSECEFGCIRMRARNGWPAMSGIAAR